jgi:hypothetical protein
VRTVTLLNWPPRGAVTVMPVVGSAAAVPFAGVIVIGGAVVVVTALPAGPVVVAPPA